MNTDSKIKNSITINAHERNNTHAEIGGNAATFLDHNIVLWKNLNAPLMVIKGRIESLIYTKLFKYKL